MRSKRIERSAARGDKGTMGEMWHWLSQIFDTEGYPARWECGSAWQAQPLWGWLHIVSDVATFGAYTAIPVLFIYFLRKRPDLPWPRLWWLFAAFIFACGIGHLLEAVIFWNPIYRVSGIVKFVTAMVSWATVLALLPIIPAVLALKSPLDLENQVRQRTAEALQANRRRKESDERLQLALSAGRMGTWNWDLKTNAVEFDAAQIELTGLGKKTGQIIADEFFERVHRDDRESLQRAVRRSIDRGEPYNHVFRLYVPERGFRWLQGRGSLLRDVAGQPFRLIGVNFDITDQMSDQESLRVRNRALESATNGIIITDARSADQPIVYANPACEALTGYTSSELLGQNCRLLQGPDTDPQAVAQLREAIAKEQECQVTLLNYRRDGAPFWNNLHISPVTDDQGNVTHFVGVQTDVTDRMENERRLQDAQHAAESANRAKSEFLANMSHEIRTPLTAILGCAETLCRDLAGEEARLTARTIRSQGELLLGVLNDVLDLSKIEAGRLEIHRTPCSILSVIADVRSLMESQATEKGLSMSATFAPALPESIVTDPLRIRQILINLLSNAIKFTERGEVGIHVDCEVGSSAPRLTVSVRDTGVGIPAHRLQAIFDAFTQADRSVERRVGGTGLGLTICQRLVRMLGGEISVASEPRVGSTFTFWLPIEQNVAEFRPVQELDERRKQKESSESFDVLIPARVLIAEDTPAIQYMLRRILEPAVNSIAVVGDGAQALDALEQSRSNQTPVDLVLMDMQMPVLDGYHATIALRERGFDLPVIALTAGAMAGDRERCLEAGCTDYLAKPVDRAQLISMVAQYALRGSPSRSEEQRSSR